MDNRDRESRLIQLEEQGKTSTDFFHTVKNLKTGTVTSIPGHIVSGFLDPAEYELSDFVPQASEELGGKKKKVGEDTNA